jgi:hypothetical protein
MDNSEIVARLTKLFQETGEAHHQAFIEVDGHDPEWPLWYADYLHDRLPPILGKPMTKSEIVYAIVSLSKIQPEMSPDAFWPSYYAMHFCQHYT